MRTAGAGFAVSRSRQARKEQVDDEAKCRQSVGFTDRTVYDGDVLKSVIGADGYAAGIRFTGTYGVNPLLCLQGYKDVLIDHGMQVFESTEVIRLEGHTGFTRGGSVTADHIIIAVDKLKGDISPLADEVFHAQTFLSVSEPLTDKDLIRLFPSGKQMQCWDSKLVYTYFRLTGDNRLLVGGGTAITTYLKDAYNNHRIISRVIGRFKKPFPFLHDLAFIQFWPGLIDATRDLLSIIVRPPQQPHLHFVLGSVGLPWAAFAGGFAARNVLGKADEDYEKYYRYFSNRRHFALPSGLVKLIGKPLMFSLSNSWTKFYQVDHHRKHDEMKGEF
jgi:gamma-glutamylputrescine oxidase